MKLAHPSTADPHYAWFHCPGCNSKHAVGIGPGGWGWNGSRDAPTLTPSVLVTYPLRAAAVRQDGDPPERCHSFVTVGRIQFLADSTHALAGQTVALPELES